MGESVTVVIPAYNEADSLPQVLPEVIGLCAQRSWEIIVVNDGSTDNTRQVLTEYQTCPGLTVLNHKVNRGYGGALKTGISHTSTDFVVTVDADGQHSLSDIDTLLKALLDSDADLVVGRREYQKAANLYRQAGKWVIRKAAGLLLPLTIHDLNSGFKLYRTRIVQKYLRLCPDSMAFSDVITLIFISQRHLVVESPVMIHERFSGRSTISTRTAVETILEILNIIMLFNPMRIFLPVSFGCVLFGVAWGLPLILMGRGVSVGSMLAIVTGVIFFFLGLVAEQLSLIRKGKTVED
jgi:glycosyltransferase involved in cell wall biosynthesis